jgi:L-threonylcarbamoyladenylate synthase
MNVDVKAIVECLSAGGVVLVPTDTVYGLAVKPDYPESVDKVYALKGRPRHLNLPIMVAAMDELALLGIDVNSPAKRLFASPFVPGALTLALGFKSQPLVPWLAGREEVAIRIPNDQDLLSVLQQTGPLLVTSANSHGQPSPRRVAEATAQLHGQPDLIVDGGLLNTTPSTLINCRLDPPVIERLGVIPELELRKILDSDRNE